MHKLPFIVKSDRVSELNIRTLYFFSSRVFTTQTINQWGKKAFTNVLIWYKEHQVQ